MSGFKRSVVFVLLCICLLARRSESCSTFSISISDWTKYTVPGTSVDMLAEKSLTSNWVYDWTWTWPAAVSGTCVYGSSSSTATVSSDTIGKYRLEVEAESAYNEYDYDYGYVYVVGGDIKDNTPEALLYGDPDGNGTYIYYELLPSDYWYATDVDLEILDSGGTTVKTFSNLYQYSGTVVGVYWDEKNDSGTYLTAGTYTVELTVMKQEDGTNRTHTDTYTIEILSVEITTPTANPTYFEKGPDLGLECEISGGAGDTVLWEARISPDDFSSSFFSDSDGLTMDFTPTAYGGYDVMVSYSKDGATVTDSMQVFVFDVEISQPSGTSQTIESGETISFQANPLGYPGGTYSWSPSFAFDNATSASPTFTEDSAGTYAVTVQYTVEGVTATSETYTVTVEDAQPTVEISASAACVTIDNTDVTLSCTTTGGDSTQPQWSIVGSPAGASLSSSQGSATTFSATNHGTYTVQVSYAGVNDTVAITVIDLTIDSPTGSSSVEVVDPLPIGCSPWPTPGGSIAWALESFQGSGTPTVTFSPSDTTEDPSFSATLSGTYTVRATFTYDGISISRVSFPFTVNPPSVTITTPPTTMELGDTLPLACLPSGSGGGTFAWSGVLNGLPISPGLFSDAEAATPTFTPTATGTYSLTVSYQKGGEVATDTVAIVVNPLSVSLAVTDPPDFAGSADYGESIDLECVPSSTDGTLIWSVSPTSDVTWDPADPTGQTEVAFFATPSQLTTYTIRVDYTKQNPLVSSTASDQVTVQVKPCAVSITTPSEFPAFAYKDESLGVRCTVQGQTGGTVTWSANPQDNVTITPDGSDPYAATFGAAECGQYELTVQYTVGGATVSDGPVTIVVWEADVDVDSDRTGDIEGSAAEDDLETSANQWAIVPVNCDKDGTGSQRDCDDTEVNGAADMEDFVPIIVRRADPTWEIRLENTDSGDFNVFTWTDADEDGQWDTGETVLLPSGGLIPAQELSAGDVQLLIEATKFPVDAATYTLTLTAQKAGQSSGTDMVEVRPSPFMLLPATLAAEEIYVVDTQGPTDTPPNDPFVVDLKNAVADVTDVDAADTGNDVWMQDEMEIGLTSWPGPGNTPRFMHVVLNLPRGKGLDNWVPGLLGPNVGYIAHGEYQIPDIGSIAGGDIEVIPGAGTHGKGAVIVGSDSALIKDFIVAQGVQTVVNQNGDPDIVLTDTSWLQIGHIDEVVSFLGDTSVAVADWAEARTILEDMNRTCVGTGAGVGANTLTNSGVVSSSTCQEGSYSGDFERGDSDRMTITDASLDSGFPLKSGDTTRNISVAGWCKLESVPPSWGMAPVFSKFDSSTGKRSFCLHVAHGGWSGETNFELALGYNQGNSARWYSLGDLSLQTGRWYHVGATYKDSDRSYRIRVWDSTAETVTERTGVADFAYNNTINVEDAPVYIGNVVGGGWAFDGLIDEVAVFNDVLTTTEIDQIRQGTYDLGSDSHCAALWRFEDGSLTMDSSGGQAIVSNSVLQYGLTNLNPSDWIDGFIEMTSGAASGQIRQIAGLVHDTQAGTTTITVTRPWDAGAEPGAGSGFTLVARSAYRAMFASGDEECGVATGGDATHLFDSTKSWNGEYDPGDPNHSYVMIVEGPGAGQIRRIASSQGTTITLAATLNTGLDQEGPWLQQPTDRSRYVIVERSKVVSQGDAMFRWPEGQDSHYNHAAVFTVVRRCLATAITNYQDGCQTDIDAIKQKVGEVIDSVSYTLVPAIYMPWTAKAASQMPDMVNFLNTGSSYVIPEPFVSQNDTAFNSKFTEWSPGSSFIDDWYFYHSGFGEIHCGTNARRTPDEAMKRWWSDDD